MKRRLRTPSPAFVISLIALFIALGGTTYAATSLPRNSVGTKQLKKNAVTSPKIKNGAVTASKLNTKGLQVPWALHAMDATYASTAASATNADHATSSDQLGGLAAAAYQRRVSGTCFTAVSSINQDGGVGCATGVVLPFDKLISSGGFDDIVVADLQLEVLCHQGGTNTLVRFIHLGPNQATLNWFDWNLNAATADGVALNPGHFKDFDFTGGRIEGQFIYSIHNGFQITVSLHAFDASSFCEATGTIEYARD